MNSHDGENKTAEANITVYGEISCLSFRVMYIKKMVFASSIFCIHCLEFLNKVKVSSNLDMHMLLYPV